MKDRSSTPEGGDKFLHRRDFVKRSVAASLLGSQPLMFSGLLRAEGGGGGGQTTTTGGWTTTGPESTTVPWTTTGGETTLPETTTEPWTTTEPVVTTPTGAWWPGTAVFTCPIRLDHDAVIDYIWNLDTTPPMGASSVKVSTQFSSKADLRTYLGWAAGSFTDTSLIQTVVWQEWLTLSDGTGVQPSNFRNLSWSYDGNRWVNVKLIAGKVVPDIGKVGFFVQTEGYDGLDTWQIGSMVLSPNTPHIVGSLVPRFYPSNDTTEQTGDKAQAVFGTAASNQSIQPQACNTIGEWAGCTGNGVGSLEVRHRGNNLAKVYVTLKDGHALETLLAGDARPKLPPGVLPKIVVTDWQNDRGPVTTAGTYIVAGSDPNYPNDTFDQWSIRIKRPGILVE